MVDIPLKILCYASKSEEISILKNYFDKTANISIKFNSLNELLKNKQKEVNVSLILISAELFFSHQIPELMLPFIAFGEEKYITNSLSCGAEDFINTPLTETNVTSRIDHFFKNKFKCLHNNVVLEYRNNHFYINKKLLPLSHFENKILQLLLTNRGICFSIDKITSILYLEKSKEAIIMIISRLKKKLSMKDKSLGDLIACVNRQGYIIYK